MDTLIAQLEQIKKLLRAFEREMAEQKSDVDLAVDEIERIRSESIQPLIASDELLKDISGWLSAWTAQATQLLEDESLDGFQASTVFSKITLPSYNTIIARIDTYIYQQTGNLHAFIMP